MNSTQLKRIQQGLCVWCGETNDKTTQLCSKCTEKKNAKDKERREMRLFLRLCPKCGNRLYGDERNCLECRVKNSIAKEKLYAEDKDKQIKRTSECRRRRNERLKKQGICITCGKEKTDGVNFTCIYCRTKRRMNRFEYQSIHRNERTEKGLCYICGANVEKGYKVCKKHHQMYIDMFGSKKSKFNGGGV